MSWSRRGTDLFESEESCCGCGLFEPRLPSAVSVWEIMLAEGWGRLEGHNRYCGVPRATLHRTALGHP